MSKASTILRDAADTIDARARLRDQKGERSMLKAVRSFNALTGLGLTEKQGWMFMAVLKLARESHGHDPDNFLDAAAYMALAGESVAMSPLTRLPEPSVLRDAEQPYGPPCELCEGD